MFDFNCLLDGSLKYNFHSHTQFCDGRAPMEQFAAEAVRRGFTHYGFSPHSPIAIPSPCNMKTSDVPLYLDEVARLRHVHRASGTRFLASMEIDFLSRSHGPACAYFQDLPLDYRIGSVHFIPSQSGEYIDVDGHFDRFRDNMSRHFHNDIRYVVNTFFDQNLEMLSAGGFDMIGHYDKIGQNASYFQPGIENEGWYVDRLEELTRAVIASGVTVEINTKAFVEHHRFFPSPSQLPALLDAGVPIVVNSDAHRPELIDASRDEAFAILDRQRRASSSKQ